MMFFIGFLVNFCFRILSRNELSQDLSLLMSLIFFQKLDTEITGTLTITAWRKRNGWCNNITERRLSWQRSRVNSKKKKKLFLMKTVVQCWWLFSLVNSLCCVGVLHPPLNYFLSTHLPLPLLCVLPRRWPDLSHLCLVTLLTPAGYKYLSLPASSFMLSTHSEYQCWYSLY